ncbi:MULTISPECIES: TetR/AcrR family transcriptional regulator [unclassified Pseudomonas]|jgi:TetR/AcrR family transcriptional repressor of nem operon|uniref:TetR/AcrR family transcriptional regulator n=1 Tax=unclassified Pseudomonas TaxID=196821 RepID=UPI000837D754|nr:MULTISPECIES: TetR/AcrR family transcriptional regulator [unclassified Pseudomonas]QIH07311.1 TetR/AcrR family transcriptional regulator [Pseudomonas sp. BIOMIG1BAC]
MARPQEFDTAEALHKAMVVFWRKGYEATSMVDLLDATGLSKSSLYGTFGGKRELFVTAFDAYRNEREKDMSRVLAQGHARQAIEEFFRMLFVSLGALEPARGCMSINQGVEMAPHDPEIRARVMEDFRHIEDALTSVIERGQGDGSLTSTRNARELARLLVLAFPGLQVMARIGYAQADLDDSLSLLLSNLD